MTKDASKLMEKALNLSSKEMDSSGFKLQSAPKKGAIKAASLSLPKFAKAKLSAKRISKTSTPYSGKAEIKVPKPTISVSKTTVAAIPVAKLPEIANAKDPTSKLPFSKGGEIKDALNLAKNKTSKRRGYAEGGAPLTSVKPKLPNDPNQQDDTQTVGGNPAITPNAGLQQYYQSLINSGSFTPTQANAILGTQPGWQNTQSSAPIVASDYNSPVPGTLAPGSSTPTFSQPVAPKTSEPTPVPVRPAYEMGTPGGTTPVTPGTAPTPKTVETYTPSDDYMNNFYTSVTGKELTPEQIETWRNATSTGQYTNEQIQQAIMNTPEARAKFTQDFLGRPITQEEQNLWANYVNSGQLTNDQIQDQILKTAQMDQVGSLYKYILGQTADQNTLDYFKDQINQGNMNLDDVSSLLLSRPEYQSYLNQIMEANKSGFTPVDPYDFAGSITSQGGLGESSAIQPGYVDPNVSLSGGNKEIGPYDFGATALFKGLGETGPVPNGYLDPNVWNQSQTRDIFPTSFASSILDKGLGENQKLPMGYIDPNVMLSGRDNVADKYQFAATALKDGLGENGVYKPYVDASINAQKVNDAIRNIDPKDYSSFVTQINKDLTGKAMDPSQVRSLSDQLNAGRITPQEVASKIAKQENVPLPPPRPAENAPQQGDVPLPPPRPDDRTILSKIMDRLGSVGQSVSTAIQEGASALGKKVVDVINSGPGFTTVKYDDGSIETRKGDFGWRQFNPGNVKYSDKPSWYGHQFGAMKGGKATDGGYFTVFPSLEAADAAREYLLFDSPTYKDLTLKEAMYQYAPPKTNPHVDDYIKKMAEAAGASITTKMRDFTPEQRKAMLKSQTGSEGNRVGKIITVKAGDGGQTPPIVPAGYKKPDVPTPTPRPPNLTGGITTPEELGFKGTTPGSASGDVTGYTPSGIGVDYMPPGGGGTPGSGSSGETGGGTSSGSGNGASLQGDGSQMVATTKTIQVPVQVPHTVTVPGQTHSFTGPDGNSISYQDPATTKTTYTTTYHNKVVSSEVPAWQAAGFQSQGDYASAADSGMSSANQFYAAQHADASSSGMGDILGELFGVGSANAAEVADTGGSVWDGAGWVSGWADQAPQGPSTDYGYSTWGPWSEDYYRYEPDMLGLKRGGSVTERGVYKKALKLTKEPSLNDTLRLAKETLSKRRGYADGGSPTDPMQQYAANLKAAGMSQAQIDAIIGSQTQQAPATTAAPAAGSNPATATPVTASVTAAPTTAAQPQTTATAPVTTAAPTTTAAQPQVSDLLTKYYGSADPSIASYINQKVQDGTYTMPQVDAWLQTPEAKTWYTGATAPAATTQKSGASPSLQTAAATPATATATTPSVTSLSSLPAKSTVFIQGNPYYITTPEEAAQMKANGTLPKNVMYYSGLQSLGMNNLIATGSNDFGGTHYVAYTPQTAAQYGLTYSANPTTTTPTTGGTTPTTGGTGTTTGTGPQQRQVFDQQAYNAAITDYQDKYNDWQAKTNLQLAVGGGSLPWGWPKAPIKPDQSAYVKTVTEAAPSQDQINALTRNIIGRNATTDEMKQWSDYINSGKLNNAQILQSMKESPEADAYSQSIRNDYVQQVLGRDMTKEEQDNWKKYVSSGMTNQQIAASIAKSPEAMDYNKSIINNMFTNATGMELQPDQVNTINNDILAGKYTLDQVQNAWLNSVPAKQYELQEYYKQQTGEDLNQDQSKQLYDALNNGSYTVDQIKSSMDNLSNDKGIDYSVASLYKNAGIELSPDQLVQAQNFVKSGNGTIGDLQAKIDKTNEIRQDVIDTFDAYGLSSTPEQIKKYADAIDSGKTSLKEVDAIISKMPGAGTGEYIAPYQVAGPAVSTTGIPLSNAKFKDYASEKLREAKGVLNENARKLLDFIGKGEGTYDSFNNGKALAGDKSLASKQFGKPLEDFTIGELLDMGKGTPKTGRKVFAIGKYQMIPEVFREMVQRLGIDPNAKFNKEMQDYMGLGLITIKRPNLGKYLAGASDDLKKAWADLGHEFGSIPGMGGKSLLGKGNKAHHTVGETRGILQKTKGGIFNPKSGDTGVGSVTTLDEDAPGYPTYNRELGMPSAKDIESIKQFYKDQGINLGESLGQQGAGGNVGQGAQGTGAGAYIPPMIYQPNLPSVPAFTPTASNWQPSNYTFDWSNINAGALEQAANVNRMQQQALNNYLTNGGSYVNYLNALNGGTSGGGTWQGQGTGGVTSYSGSGAVTFL